MHPPRSPRGSPRWKGSTGGPHRSDPQDGHGVGGTPPPSSRTRLAEFRRGSISGLPRVGIGEIGEECTPGVFNEKTRELGAGVVPGPHDVAYAGHGRSFRRPHDDARHRFQEPVSFLDGEGQLAPRTTARQFAREGESGRPDHEERDEPADDQEIREPDLVELAVVPEPGDEDEGDQKQESGADQECPEAGVHRAHPIARATSNRPFSKRSVWSSLSWFTLRIFTHWTRRWNEVSVTGSRRRWRIPSARNSSSNAVGGASRAGSSEISRLVTPRSRSHSKKPNVSARGSPNSRTSTTWPCGMPPRSTSSSKPRMWVLTSGRAIALPHELIARVTRNRPSSKSIARYPVSCFVARIFTTRRRRWAVRSVTKCIRRWITPSARNSSSYRPWSTCPATTQSGRSVTRKLVVPRSRSHSNSR